MRLVPALALVAMIVVSACGGFAAKGTAEDAVARFHQQLDGERWDEMWEEADDLFKGSTTRAKFTELFAAIHRKLGNVTSSKQTGFFGRDQVGTNAGSYVEMTYETEFAEGRATEKFNWRVYGQRVRLVGYNVNSSALITN